MKYPRKYLILFGIVMLAVGLSATSMAQQEHQARQKAYTVKPGDRLEVSVWNEPELSSKLLVAPDGGIAFPLVGEINVIGKSIVAIRQEISDRLSRYISDPIVTVTIEEVLGNMVYVLGQVNKPGQFVVNPMVDVMQALSMAGGTTAYASLNNIIILRRNGQQQEAIRFRYGDVVSGKNLSKNVVLQAGDVVVVP